MTSTCARSAASCPSRAVLSAIACALATWAAGCGNVGVAPVAGEDGGFGVPGDDLGVTGSDVGGGADGDGDTQGGGDDAAVDGSGDDASDTASDPDGTTDGEADAASDALGTDAGPDAGPDAGADTSADAAADANTDAAGDSATADSAADAASDASDASACPNKPEACNGKDDDCDGETDEATCDDGDGCTVDTCLGAMGCGFEVKAAPCDDGDPCTSGEACSTSGCGGGKATDCADADVCTQDFCKPGEGCGHAPGFGPCDDGDGCSEGDACSEGACKGKAKDCNDGFACTTDGCEPSKGCVHVDNAAPCDDSDICTANDACKAGACKGEPGACKDGNACTQDGCDKVTGCAFAPASGPCDDGDVCTLSDTCQGGACKGASAQPCDDGKPCTTDACAAGQGCSHTPLAGPCDDGDACSEGEACDTQGACKGKPQSCDDGNTCTTDACDAKKGCVATAANEGASCGAGSSGTCKAGVCQLPNTCPAGKLGGSFSIAPGQPYPTFAKAIQALTAGVCAPTTFVVSGGTYKEPGIVFAPINGASASAIVRFEAAKGQSVKLSGVGGGSSYGGVIKFDNGASYIQVAGFEIDGKDPANKIPGSYSGIIAFGSGGNQQHIRIERLWIHDFGASAWASANYVGGAYLQQSAKTVGIEFIGNRFENLQPPSTFHTQGAIITRNGAHQGMRIVGNTFIGIVGMAAIRLRSGTGWDDLLVANNVFVQTTGQSALDFYSSNAITGKAQFVFNSVQMLGSGAVVAGSITGKLDVRNNAARGASNALVSGTTLGAYGANCLEGVSAPSGANASPADVVGTIAYQSAAAPYDLHLQANSACLGKGVGIADVTTDLDGEARQNPPDIGADER